MGENPLPSTPMQVISADLIGPLAESVNGNRYALTVICLCSGWCEVYPIKDKQKQTKVYGQNSLTNLYHGMVLQKL